MTPTPIPFAFRAFTRRRKAGPAPESPAGPPSGTTPRRRPARGEWRWPPLALIFDCETTTDETQRLTFGSYRVVRLGTHAAPTLVGEGLFHADDLGDWNPSALTELRAYADRHGLVLKSRREFVERVLWPIGYESKGLIVGFNLPFDLSRIAIDSGEARGRNHGGFSFTVWDYVDTDSGEWRPNPYRPRIVIASLDSKRAFISFTRPQGATASFRGHFLDLRSLAFALSAEGHSLASACDAFGVEHGKLAVETHGQVTSEYIDYNRRDVLATEELLVRLRTEFDRLGLPLWPTQAYSPASIAKATYRALGVHPLLTKSDGITDEDLGRVMMAYYGARAECRIRRVSVPVVTVDFRSNYLTVNCLLGLWALVIAERLRFVECTEDVRSLLANASVTNALDKTLWPQLAGFAEVAPDEDILPGRGKYAETRDGLNIGVNIVSAATPFTYALPDLYASALLTGKPPTITRAWRLVGEGVQPGLTPMLLWGTTPFDPRTDNLYTTLVEERVRVKASADGPLAQRDRLAQQLKIVANAGAYGVFAEINRAELPMDAKATIDVFADRAPFAQTTRTPEEPGELFFPPIAALNVAGARLLLALLETLVTERGGHYAFCDTDSMAIVATEAGGLVPCDGGTDGQPDDVPAIRALSWADVAAIKARIDAALNPYNPTVISSILNIEDKNYENGVQRQLYAYVVSAKRYALFVWRADGTIELVDPSGHGLGHLLSPLEGVDGETWLRTLWQLILDEAHDLPHKTPAWLRYPAVSRVSVSTPAYFRGFLKRYAELPYPERVKPFGFLLSAQVARLSHPGHAEPTAFHLLAPFSKRPSDCLSQLWTDAYSGVRYGITTSMSYVSHVVRVKSIERVKADFLAHGEVKSATQDGAPAEGSARGLLQRRHVTPSEIQLIGKESNAFEFVEAGLFHDRDDVLSSYDDGGSTAETFLTTQPASVVARVYNVTVRTVRNWRKRGRGGPGQP